MEGDGRGGLAAIIWPSGAALIALGVYLLTMAPDLTWSHYGTDGGELATAAATLGVPHPPGYPTYVLVGHMFSRLPLGNSIAFRLNLLSAVSGAVAVGLATAAAGHWTRQNARQPHGVAPLAAGLALAFMPLVWSQAIITEVYALNLALLAAFLWALLGRRPAWAVGLLLGLSVTTHLTSALMLPLALVCTQRQGWSSLLGGLLLGLAPFLALPLLAQSGSPIIWNRPQQLQGWWRIVSARIYRPNVFALPADRWAERVQQWSRLFFAQFAWVGAALLPLGVSETWTKKSKQQAAILGTASLYGAYAFGYNTTDAPVFFLPGLLLLVLPLADAFSSIEDNGYTQGVAGSLGRKAVVFLLPLALLMLNFNGLNLSDDWQVRRLVEPVLEEAPPDAILLTTGDRATFSLWYLHYAEGQRPDVIPVDSNLLAFAWYRERLAQRYPSLGRLQQDDLGAFRTYNARFRPLCEVTFTLAGAADVSCTEPARVNGRP
ncbi:MAG: DUF2723 domain-containing protein [Candidatus Promineifilaceae bacterium]|nr:DUF2723 domain-containing protein [Candidatus Promineifilaceae bacterium]